MDDHLCITSSSAHVLQSLSACTEVIGHSWEVYDDFLCGRGLLAAVRPQCAATTVPAGSTCADAGQFVNVVSCQDCAYILGGGGAHAASVCDACALHWVSSAVQPCAR